MFSMVQCVLPCLLSLAILPRVASQTTGFAGVLTTPDDFVTGKTPTGLSLDVYFTNGISANGNTIVLTLSKALFGGGISPTCAVTGGAGNPTWSTIVTNGAGTEVTFVLNTGTVNAGETLNFAFSSNFATLPSAGIVTLTATSTGDTAGAPVGIFQILATPSITLTTANMYITTVPTQLVISFNVPFELNQGEIVKLTSSHYIWNVLQTTGLATTGIQATSHTTDAFGGALDITLDSPSFAAGTAATITMTSPILAQLPSVGKVTIDLILNGIYAWDNAEGFGVITNPGLMGNDPVARYGDVVRLFELPPALLTPLISSPFIAVHGSVFEGDGPWEQWFNRIVLTLPEPEQSSDQARFIDIKRKDHLEEIDLANVPDDAFSTLDVTLGYGHISNPTATAPLRTMSTNIPKSFLGHQVMFRRVPQTGPKIMPRECADVAGPNVHFYVCSSPAREYWGPLGHLALKYSHLDLAFMEVENMTTLTGLLPELWGTQPMSEGSRKFVKNNKTEAVKPKIVESEHSATAWAGGVGMEDLHKGCLEKHESDVMTTV